MDIERRFYQNRDPESLRLSPPLNIEHATVKRQTSQRSHYVIDSCAPQKRAVASGKIQLHALTHGHYPGRLLPPRVLPGLSSLGFWDASGEQDWGLEPHRNEGIEIVFLETGQHFFQTLAYRRELTERLGLTDVRDIKPEAAALRSRPAQ